MSFKAAFLAAPTKKADQKFVQLCKSRFEESITGKKFRKYFINFEGGPSMVAYNSLKPSRFQH
jgi:hypothetical protein